MLLAVLFLLLPFGAWCGPDNLPPPPVIENASPSPLENPPPTAEHITNPPPPPDLPANPLPGPPLDEAHLDFGDNIQQPIDHAKPQGAKFAQRVFVEPRFAKDLKTAPVIYFLCGESECRASAPPALKEIAQKNGAILVQLEHRYYGESRPFAKLTKDNLKYLSVEQALADTESAQKYLQEKYGYHGSWIVSGCSYPGALAAFYRTTHPERVKGAIVSGAPVEASWEFAGYEAWVYEMLGKNCAQKVKAGLADFNEIFSHQDEAVQAEWRKQFGFTHINDGLSALSAVTNMVQGAVQYGQRNRLCETMEKNPDPKQALVRFMVDESYTNLVEPMGNFKAWMNEEVVTPDLWNMRAWTYQTCSQFGFGQAAARNCEFSLFPVALDVALYEKTCVGAFSAMAKDKISAFNQKYLARIQNKQTRNILFITGSEDPWALLSVRKGNNRNPYNSTYTVRGGSHCSELDSISGDNANARALMEKAFERWK